MIIITFLIFFKSRKYVYEIAFLDDEYSNTTMQILIERYKL